MPTQMTTYRLPMDGWSAQKAKKPFFLLPMLQEDVHLAVHSSTHHLFVLKSNGGVRRFGPRGIGVIE